MIEKKIRQMTLAERKSIEESISSPPHISLSHTIKWCLIWTVALASLISLAALSISLLNKINEDLGRMEAAIPMLIAIACLYGLISQIISHFNWLRVFLDFNSNTLPLLKQALEGQEVLAVRVRASSVIEIDAFDDEGSGYIFDIGGGKSFLLKGAGYYAIEESMPWPAAEFEIVKSVDEVLWIAIFSRGDELEPVESISMDQCTEEFVHSNREEEVLDAEPRVVLQGILDDDQASSELVY